MKTRNAIIALAAIAILGGGYIAYATLSPAAQRRAAAQAKVQATARKREAVADLVYPVAASSLSPTIRTEYDAAHDRTRMTLEFKDLSPSAAAGYRVSNVDLKLVSEFAGQTRDPERGELSARCSIALVVDNAGALAPSSPPATILADGKELHGHPVSTTSPGYKSEHRADGARESLTFLIRTRDLIRLSAAASASVRAGAMTFTLSPSQILQIREFTAHMNPKAGAAAPAQKDQP